MRARLDIFYLVLVCGLLCTGLSRAEDGTAEPTPVSKGATDEEGRNEVDTSTVPKYTIAKTVVGGTVYADMSYEVNGVAAAAPLRVSLGHWNINGQLLSSEPMAIDGSFHDFIGAPANALAVNAAVAVRLEVGAKKGKAARVKFTSCEITMTSASETFTAKSAINPEKVFPLEGEQTKKVVLEMHCLDGHGRAWKLDNTSTNEK